MKSTTYKCIELFVLFVLIPVSLVFPLAIWIKMLIGLWGFIYVIYVLLWIEKVQFKISPSLDWRSFWKSTLIKLLFIIVITTLFVWLTNKELLFQVLLNKPSLWIFILFIYSLFSVYPQELIYRTFYFQRYEVLLKNKKLFIFINALLFSLAHIFFKNTLVLVLTFLGGILFALTFKKTRSTVLVSIEHAIYGCWLFTVGMGEMLGFPT